MEAQQSQYKEIVSLVKDWARRTDQVILSEIRRLRIGFKKELYPSIRSKVIELGANKIQAQELFLTYGRFVDMGAGPGSEKNAPFRTLAQVIQKVETAEGNRAILTKGRPKKVRKPKAFYSRAYYSRLNALLGVVSGSMVEEAIRIVKELDDDASGGNSDNPFDDMAMYM